MATLLLRLEAPMQAWGTTSKFDERDCQLEPSKSGVIGLICAALGRDRSDPVDDLATMKMGVRVDAEGILMRDFQTIQGMVKANSKLDKERVVVSPRFYLADASFLVGLESEDLSLLERIHKALLTPYWPLCLGRKSFPPGIPVFLKDGIKHLSLKDALLEYPLYLNNKNNFSNKDRPETIRVILEDRSQGLMRMDQPIAPYINREFGPRLVNVEPINIKYFKKVFLGGESVSIDN